MVSIGALGVKQSRVARVMFNMARERVSPGARKSRIVAGTRIVTGGLSDKLGLWDAEGEPVVSVIGEGETARANSVSFSPDGKPFVAGGRGFDLQQFDADGRPARVMKGHDAEVQAIRWSPDGSRIASTDSNGELRLWDPKTLDNGVFSEHSGKILTLEWSRDSKQFVTGGTDNIVRTFSVGGEVQQEFRGHEHRVYALAWHPDGRRLISSSRDATFRIWDRDGDETVVAGEYDSLLIGKFQWWKSTGWGALVWAPGGKQFVAGNRDGALRFWNVDEGLVTLAKEVFGQGDAIYCVDWHVPSRRILTAGKDGTIRLWNLDTDKTEWIAHVFSDAKPVTLSADGRYLYGDRESVAKKFRYLVKTPSGATELLTQAEFQKRP